MTQSNDPHTLFTQIVGNATSGMKATNLSAAKMRLDVIQKLAQHGVDITATPTPPDPPPPPPNRDPLTSHVYLPGDYDGSGVGKLGALEIAPEKFSSGGILPQKINIYNASCNQLYITSAVDLNIYGIDCGPIVKQPYTPVPGKDPGHPMIKSYAGQPQPNNILIQEFKFYGARRGPQQPTDLSHTEGLQISGGNNITLRHGVFEDNAVFDLFIRYFTGSITNLLIDDVDFYGSIDQNVAVRIAYDGQPITVAFRNVRLHNGASISIDGGVTVLERGWKSV